MKKSPNLGWFPHTHHSVFFKKKNSCAFSFTKPKFQDEFSPKLVMSLLHSTHVAMLLHFMSLFLNPFFYFFILFKKNRQHATYLKDHLVNYVNLYNYFTCIHSGKLDSKIRRMLENAMGINEYFLCSYFCISETDCVCKVTVPMATVGDS